MSVLEKGLNKTLEAISFLGFLQEFQLQHSECWNTMENCKKK